MAGDDASPALTGATAVVAVAYSGGRDSTALLHATLAAAVEVGVHVLALHVHHGLHPQADDWLGHCEVQCSVWRRRGWPVTLHTRHLHLSPARGESIEAMARIARYRALREMAVMNGCDTVLLAHHRRDQAETFLLQALRGAGPSGLAAMPRVAVRDGVTWLRPWLDRPREAIDAYVRRYRLRHIDDTSNDDTRLARNRMRLAVWPALLAAFPDAEATLAEAARKAQDARSCLTQLAELDLAGCETPQGLRIPALSALGEARACNALRAWCRRCTGRALPAAMLGQVWRGVRTTRAAQWPLPDGHVLSLYRGRLALRRPAPTLPSPQPVGARAGHLSIRRAGLYRLPGWGGALRARRVREGGMALARLVELELVERVGGERFQAGAGRPARSLKKQYQAGAVPAWERGGPLVYAQGQLAYVPGLGLDARVLAQAGEPQLSLCWEPDAKR